MALNRKTPKLPIAPPPASPIKITKDVGRNYFGKDANLYGLKSELFLAATGSLHSKDQHYRAGETRDARVSELAKLVAAKDPDWISRFVPWLRDEANIRTSAITIAVDAAYVMTKSGIPGGRQLVGSALLRADEPGEALAYAMATYGRAIPKAVKRGIADAASRLYTEFNWLKHDSASDGLRFADVLELCHPDAKLPGQGILFKHIIDDRQGRPIFMPGLADALPTVYNNFLLKRHFAARTGKEWLNPITLRVAGMTWEDVLSQAGDTIPKKDLWEALIPTMGYMALLRNLRNFEQAGISAAATKLVQDRLANPAQVAKSRQLPMRFLAAYNAVQGDRFKWSLEQGLDACLANVPALPGRTLILVDQSPSMFPGRYYALGHSHQHKDSEISLAQQAAIFGSALALRADHADLVQYGMTSERMKVRAGSGILSMLGEFNVINGTDTRRAVRDNFAGHDRIIVVTDEQTVWPDVFNGIPDSVFKATWNLAGYQASQTSRKTVNHVSLGGLSDQMFKLLPVLESRESGGWPF